jgi:L-asparaginase II
MMVEVASRCAAQVEQADVEEMWVPVTTAALVVQWMVWAQIRPMEMTCLGKTAPMVQACKEQLKHPEKALMHFLEHQAQQQVASQWPQQVHPATLRQTETLEPPPLLTIPFLPAVLM